MSKKRDRLNPRSAGFLRLWTERMINEGRKISAADLAREASVVGAPVQPSTPWSMVLGREVPAEQEARVYAYLDVQLDEVEEIGAMEGWL